MRELIKIYGSKSLVFIDESGFEAEPTCIYAWAKKGKKVFGDRTGKRGKRENLITARRKGSHNLIAPMLLTVSVNAAGFKNWLSMYLLPELNQPSILIMDNAPIHRKIVIKEMVEESVHQVLFLPKYSPELNEIEHDLSALKRSRMYADPGTSIDEIMMKLFGIIVLANVLFLFEITIIFGNGSWVADPFGIATLYKHLNSFRNRVSYF